MQPGGAGNPLNYPVDNVTLGNGNNCDTEIPAFNAPCSGTPPDNRLGLYVGDSWKVKPNLMVTYGLRYVRDTGRTDSDLPPLPGVNDLLPGFGNRVHQPNLNFAPQLGIAWDPKKDQKTVIRAGIGMFYENAIWNNAEFDRPERLANGAFLANPSACLNGSGSGVPFPAGNTFLGGTQNTANDICSSLIGSTIDAGGGTCAGLTAAVCVANFQTTYQAATAMVGAKRPKPQLHSQSDRIRFGDSARSAGARLSHSVLDTNKCRDSAAALAGHGSERGLSSQRESPLSDWC